MRWLAWENARGQIVAQKAALQRITACIVQYHSFVKVCACHTLSAWIECWLWVCGIGIFPCFINCRAALIALSTFSVQRQQQLRWEKLYYIALRRGHGFLFYFSISTDSLNPESCHDYFYDYTRVLFAFIFKHFIVCERVGAQCSSSNNKSAHQHH